MVCKNCGAPVPEGSKFCNNCGRSVQPGGSQGPQSQSAAPGEAKYVPAPSGRRGRIILLSVLIPAILALTVLATVLVMHMLDKPADAPAPTVAAAGIVPALSGPATPVPAAPVYKVGICQLMAHPALDAATQGFMDALNEALPDQVTFDNQDAGNDMTECSAIVNQFVADAVDLMLCSSTPVLRTAADATEDIPILGTCVTEYGVALEINGFTGTVGGNISGTSDLAPLGAQAAMIREWFPPAKTVGIVYCSNEANSQYQVDIVKAELERRGYTAELYAFADSNDLSDVVQNAVDNSDVLYIPTDNTAASNTGVIDSICRPAKKPVFCGEESICKGCGVATLSISYYDLGVVTGKMAARILTGEAYIAEMPIEYANGVPKYNAEICADLGLTPPEGYEAIDSY